jgi:hypothetical protein
MQNSSIECVVKVCNLLNKHSVEYLIVGGTAVALHGYQRYSRKSSGAVADKPDLDIWYNPTYKNYYNVLNALDELGVDVSKFREEKTPIQKNHSSEKNSKNIHLIFCRKSRDFQGSFLLITKGQSRRSAN